MHNPTSVLENETHKLPWNFEIQTDHLISARRLTTKKGTGKIVDFAVLVDSRVKLKENKKKDKNFNLDRKLKKKKWNIEVTIIQIVIGDLVTVTEWVMKGLEYLKIRGWVETIQTIALLRSARMVSRVLETWGDLLSLKLQWKMWKTIKE